MNSADAIREIKDKALSMGARVAGVASVEAINQFAPPGYRPDDILKGAKSVVVLGGNEPTMGAWRSGTNRVLGSIGYNRSMLGAAARKLAYYLEDNYGYFAIPVPSGNATGHYPYISLKLCAELAGLGTRSMAAGILLNPLFGLLYFNGFVEGWAMYAQNLAGEIGWLPETSSRLSELNSQLFRAVRIAVDLGIHYKRWPKTQALKYMEDNLGWSSESEVDRYSVWPGQATCYTLGRLKIMELREKAKRELGSNFDLKNFHMMVLENGSLPLDLLEEIVDEYINMNK
jgi:hypothetical protein